LKVVDPRRQAKLKNIIDLNGCRTKERKMDKGIRRGKEKRKRKVKSEKGMRKERD